MNDPLLAVDQLPDIDLIKSDEYDDAIKKWHSQNPGYFVSADVEMVNIADQKYSKSFDLNIHPIHTDQDQRLGFHYILSEYKLRNGSVRLLSFDVRVLSRLNGKSCTNRFLVMKNPPAAAARHVAKFTETVGEGDYIDLLVQKIKNGNAMSA